MEANAEAAKEWQAAIDVWVYTVAPRMARECPEVKTSIARNQAGFTPEELELLMEQRYWCKTKPTLSIICAMAY